MNHAPRLSRSLAAGAACVAASVLYGTAGLGQTTSGTTGSLARGASAERECLFMPGTAIPRLAMGVCRPGDSAEDRADGDLKLWATTVRTSGEEPAAIRPLFVPLYVYEERPGIGTTMYRLGMWLTAGGTVANFQDWQQHLKDLTAADVQRVGQQVLRLDQSTLAVLVGMCVWERRGGRGETWVRAYGTRIGARTTRKPMKPSV